jgi:threonine dehydratase
LLIQRAAAGHGGENPDPPVPNLLTIVSLDEIRAAQRLTAGRLVRTPLVPAAHMAARTGARVSLKLELFQVTGSFKPRGVLNALETLTPDERRRGVISMSAGNHAQALAWAATAIGVRATIVMPAGAVRRKVEATKALGGEVVMTDGNLLATVQQLQQERNHVFVHPFDDPRVIAGQGTVGLEIAEDAPDVDLVVVGCGGGGLLAGVAAAVKSLHPSARIIGVEPAGADAMRQSLIAGEPVVLSKTTTLADGLAAPFAGTLPLEHAQALVDEIVVLEDDEILEGMKTLMEHARILPEPAGAAATAALLSGRLALQPGAHAVSIVSGGNADPDLLKRLL